MRPTLFAISIFLGYLVGQFTVAWVLASNSVNSKLNGIETYAQYLRLHAAIITYRFVLGFGVLLIYSQFREPICASLAGLPGLGWLGRYPIPINPATALIFGLFADPAIHALFGLLGRKVPGMGFLVVEVPAQENSVEAKPPAPKT